MYINTLNPPVYVLNITVITVIVASNSNNSLEIFTSTLVD